MSKLKVFDLTGTEVGEMVVALEVSSRGTQAVHDAVVAHLAAQRAGTASTLRKGEVAGSNRKPWKQKGTGRARAGVRQSPVWRGGGVAFGPHPRSYAFKLNKKVHQAAFRKALGERVNAGDVRIFDSLTVQEPRTRAMSSLLNGLGVHGSVLMILNDADQKVLLAARNLPGVDVALANEVNVYQILKCAQLLVTRTAMATMVERAMRSGQRKCQSKELAGEIA